MNSAGVTSLAKLVDVACLLKENGRERDRDRSERKRVIPSSVRKLANNPMIAQRRNNNLGSPENIVRGRKLV